MTSEDIFLIRNHIEIHARKEPQAVKITKTLWKAVQELEHTRWHFPSKGELPEPNKPLRLYIDDEIPEIKTRLKRSAFGTYREMFLDSKKMVFREESKGYSCEYLPQSIIAWQYLSAPPEEKA